MLYPQHRVTGRIMVLNATFRAIKIQHNTGKVFLKYMFYSLFMYILSRDKGNRLSSFCVLFPMLSVSLDIHCCSFCFLKLLVSSTERCVTIIRFIGNLCVCPLTSQRYNVSINVLTLIIKFSVSVSSNNL